MPPELSFILELERQESTCWISQRSSCPESRGACGTSCKVQNVLPWQPSPSRRTQTAGVFPYLCRGREVCVCVRVCE